MSQKSKATRNKGGTSKSTAKVSVVSLLTTIVAVSLFFCLGLYVGSKIVSKNNNNINPILGLPNTNNNFIKWDENNNDNKSNADKKHNYLRMEDAQAAVEDAMVDARDRAFMNKLMEEEKKEVKEIKKHSNLRVSDALQSTTSKKVSNVDNSSNSNKVLLSADRSLSLHAKPGSYMEAPNSLDHSDIIVSAWILLDESGSYDNDMRTIFSNKHAGCESSPSQHGISLFINAWQQRDHKIYVEYGGAHLGCHKLDSGNVKLLDSNAWHHIAMYSNGDTTEIYLDAELVAQKSFYEGHEVQSKNPFIVGAFNSQGDYPFHGNISSVAILHNVASLGIDTVDLVKQLMNSDNTIENIKDIPGIASYYSLADAAHGMSGSTAIDAISTKNGKYYLPIGLTGANVGGVKIALVDGVGGRPVTDEMKQESDRVARERRESVKKGMQHAWSGYKRYAWGRDEVKPISNRGSDNWGGMGVTLVDSLDTLWIMGLKQEFNEAKDWVENSLSFDRAGTVSVFETTIRELGGLLAAYDLSGEKIFLQKARELADLLMPAFNTQSGIPTGQVNFRTGSGTGGWAGSSAILSELGSLQVEFRYLAHHTKEQKYEQKSMKPMQVMHSKRSYNGLYPIRISIRDGGFADSQVTFGALGDSFYEYLLKIWVQGGRKENWLREMYDRAIDGVVDKLLLASDPSGLAYLSDWNGRFNNKKMDHLVCFMPGTMALGAYTDPNGIDSPRAKRDLAIAKALMYTCREMYHRMRTGISAEFVDFVPHKDFKPGHNAQFYILRPETAESLFYLNQLTGDPIYRDWAWEIWQSIDSTCRTNTAYGAIRNVNAPDGGGIDDRMESFFLAETLKYLYLVQDPDTEIDLMKYVFNTEAHPLKIFDETHTPVSEY